MSKTFLKTAKASIKKLQAKKDKLEALMNDKPYQDLFDMRREFKEEFKEYINEDNSFKPTFWTNSDVLQRLKEYSKREGDIFKRIEAQEKISSNDLVDELVKIDSEIGDLHTDIYYFEKRNKLI